MNLGEAVTMTERGMPLWFLEGSPGRMVATSAVASVVSEDGVTFGSNIHRSLSQVFATQKEALASVSQEAD
jgi:hypothetical protein